MERLREVYYPDDGIISQLGTSDTFRRVDSDDSTELLAKAGQRLERLCSLVEIDTPPYDLKTTLGADWRDAVKTLITISEYAEHDIKESDDLTRRKEQLSYPINMLLTALTEKGRSDYRVFFSTDRQVVGLAGKGYIEMPEREDPVTGETVLPQQNIEESLRVTSLNPNTFYALLFVTREDDKNLPLYGSDWDSASTHFGGKGPTFSDFGELHFGIAIGDNFFPKVGVHGVHEVLGEETDPWHYAMPWSAWKEGITWAKRGRHTKTHPCEQRNFRTIIEKYQGIKLHKFKDLIYDWMTNARKIDNVDHPIFAYYSAEIGFLSLAARIIGDSDFQAEHYQQYVGALEAFCKSITDAGVNKQDTYKPEVMLPHALQWSGFASEDQLFEYVDGNLSKFSEEFLKQML